MTMTWKTGDLRIKRPDSPAREHVDRESGEGFATEIDMDIDVNNDDTVVIRRSSSPKPRLAIHDRPAAKRNASIGNDVSMLRRMFDESSYRELQQIEIKQEGGVICLSGRLPSFFLKQTAQEIVRQQDASQKIANEIQVSGN